MANTPIGLLLLDKPTRKVLLKKLFKKKSHTLFRPDEIIKNAGNRAKKKKKVVERLYWT